MIIILLSFLFTGTIGARGEKGNALKKFETEAWNLRTDLVHNHTYDLSNLPKADSLYKKSEEMGSVLGKLYALQIRTYALVGNKRKEEFLKTVDEYIKLALENEFYDEYFDGASAKTQYLMSIEEYTKSLFEAKDMVQKAEELQNLTGIYESNMLIGQIYKYRNSWIMAEKHLKRALDAVERSEETDSIPRCLLYRELAECYSGANKHSMAIEYAKKAKEWANYDIYSCFTEWTYLFALYNAHMMEELREAYKSSMLREKENFDMLPEDMGLSLKIMEQVLEGRYDIAKRMLAENEEKGKISYNLYASMYYSAGDYKKAYDYFVAEQMRVDSVQNLLQQDQLNEMEARLNTAELRIEAEEAKLRQRQIIAIFSCAIVVLIFCTLIYLLHKRKAHNNAIEKALREAEQANNMRIHFIENMMHEIRTPLHAISGFTQVLTDPDVPTDPESDELMREAIMSNTENLTKMLNNIILLSSLDAGSEKITMTDTSVSDVIDKAIEQSERPAEGVKLMVKSDKTTTITTDADLLANALSMLISNAVKFTNEGSISVEYISDEGKHTFAITDTGCGIPQEKAEQVFERFYKVDEFIPGTGLGLSLCRAIVTALGGTVSMDTSYTQGGCRFVINL